MTAISSFTWLDYSEHERRQVMEFVDQFGDDETRDELGLGTIRDGFADLLFPGTSTIQTRARYFIFVPWVGLELERKKTPGRLMADRARTQQGRLRNALIAGGEQIGVIGYQAGLHIKRLPSSVYWYGLRRWGILRFDGTEEDYQRSVDSFYDRWAAHTRRRADRLVGGGCTPTAEGGESADVPPSNWDAHLASLFDAVEKERPTEDWSSQVSFALSRAESEYLYQRIAATAPQSLLAHLLTTRQVIADHHRFAWDVPYEVSLPPHLAEQLLNARNFSEVMHGAALVYNLLLAEQHLTGKFIPRYRKELREWWKIVEGRRAELEKWDRHRFWGLLQDCRARVGRARHFVDDWIDLTLSASSLTDIADSVAARRLVTDREQAIKPGRARIGAPETTEKWAGSSGSAQLNYRWNRPVRAIVNDILKPMLDEDHNA